MNCPICKSDSISKHLDLLQCKFCTHIFSPKINDDDYWHNLYENEYTRDDRKFDLKRNVMYSQEILWINESKKLEGNFLDVGCSYGNFFLFLPKNVNRIGLDISAKIINEAKNLHPDCTFYKQSLPEFTYHKKFNFIQFRGVLQHSTNPVENLENAISLLDNDGIIIITSLPDFSSFTYEIYKKKFYYYVPDLCPNFFTKKSFEYLLNILNLKIMSSRTPYFKTPYSNFPKDIVSFIINLIQSKTHPAFYGNIRDYIVEPHK